jgi:transposase InsO family protein
MPRIGTRKLKFMLDSSLQRHGICIGRDLLFDLLCEYGLLVRRRKKRKCITTDSDHPFKKYPNLIREMISDRPCLLWVSDITYIAVANSYCYLSLVTDAYSRKIVGYCLHTTLEKDGPLSALKMALTKEEREKGKLLIHHSDRGLQYCCKDYIESLVQNKISISMTEKGDPYENAIAERVNGILKSEFLLGKTFKNYEEALAVVNSSIATYNAERPHLSLEYRTPQQAHQKQGALLKKWKSKNEYQGES